MTATCYTTRFQVSKAEEVTPEEIADGVATLDFTKKLVIEIPAPGIGPDVFLNWSQEELREAETTAGAASRKAFAAAVLAKTAFECLLDWYLESTHMGSFVRPHAGTEEKLQHLDAEKLLGVGLSLFRDVLFEPRNRAIHGYSAVDLKSARKAYELAYLFIRSAPKTRPPGQCPIYYGDLDLDREPSSGFENKPPSRMKFLNFKGIGEVGAHGVVFVRGKTPIIAILESEGGGEVTLRGCELKMFKSAQLQSVLAALERHNPVPHLLEAHETRYLSDTLDLLSGSDEDEQE